MRGDKNYAIMHAYYDDGDFVWAYDRDLQSHLIVNKPYGAPAMLSHLPPKPEHCPENIQVRELAIMLSNTMNQVLYWQEQVYQWELEVYVKQVSDNNPDYEPLNFNEPERIRHHA